MNSEILMHTYRNLRNQVNRENERLKQQYFSNEIRRVEGDITGTWKTVNKLLNKRLKTTEIPYLEEDGELSRIRGIRHTNFILTFQQLSKSLTVLLYRLRLASDSGLRL